MMKTVNISLPAQQLQILQQQVDIGVFASISEAVRDAIRDRFFTKQKMTENGLTETEEQRILKNIKENGDKVLSFPDGMSLKKQLESLLEMSDDGV